MLDYSAQPAAVRGLAILGGVGMTAAPVFAWSVMYDIGGRPHREIGLSSGLGIVVLVAGIATLVLVAIPRLVPLAIATGLAGGAASGLFLLDTLPLRNVPDASTQLGLGLVLALGSAAITGAAGIAALAVAAAVAHTRHDG